MANSLSYSTLKALADKKDDTPINAAFHIKVYQSSSVPPQTSVPQTKSDESEQEHSFPRLQEMLGILVSGMRKMFAAAVQRRAEPTAKMTSEKGQLPKGSYQRKKQEEFETEKSIYYQKEIAELKEIEIPTHRFLFGKHSDVGYVPTIKVKGINLGVDLWVWADSPCKIHYASIPQKDENKESRAKQIEYNRKVYQPKYKVGFAIMLQKLPSNEKFKLKYEFELIEHGILATAENFLARWKTNLWERFEDIQQIYHIHGLTQPKVSQLWKDDTRFGYQRLNCCNPKLIRLCETIPSKLGVDEEMMKHVLKGETLKGLIKEKRLFYTDLEILEGICKGGKYDLCAPIALFMLNSEDDLKPIAIQLQQQKGPDNPVFLPTDDWGVWTLAKMWYNLADANYHQSVVHLGLTHLLMQIVVVHLCRNVSASHPVYKILAPHKLYLMAINDRAFEFLISPGGWVDEAMTIGSEGMLNLVAKALKEWDFFQNGIPANDFANRGVDDPNVLPKYYFRDDSIALYDCIYKYVSEYLDIYYENDNDVIEDWEVQEWVDSMAASSESGRLKGLPMKDGKGHVSTKEELKRIVAVIIFTCSATHAAVNFLQYEEYGYPPNYPSILRTPLLKDKEPKTEKDIMNALADRETVFKVLAVTYALSSKGTNSLGDFEIHYIYEAQGLNCIRQFRSNLEKISEKIINRNIKLSTPYEVLNPLNIPNAISI